MERKVMDRKEFKQRVLAWAKIINVQPKKIHIKKMVRKWGSCSRNGAVNFSIDLLSQRLEFIDYVIIHELLLLKYPEYPENNKVFKLIDIYLKESYKLAENL